MGGAIKKGFLGVGHVLSVSSSGCVYVIVCVYLFFENSLSCTLKLFTFFYINIQSFKNL